MATKDNNKKYCRCDICDVTNHDEPSLRFTKDHWGPGFLCENCVASIVDSLSEFGTEDVVDE